MDLSLTEQLTYYALRIISRIITYFPRRTGVSLGKALGTFVWYIFPIRKARSMKNLSIAFPSNPETENARILKKTYQHFGIVLMDFMRMPGMNLRNTAKYMEMDDASMNLLKQTGHGILISAHLGNWEMFPPVLGLNGIKFTGVALVQKNRGANAFFKWIRESTGSKIIFKKRESSKKMVDIVKDGFLGLASDQYAGKNGVWLDFFGRQTSSPAGAAVFYLKTGCPMLFCICTLTKNYRYKFTIEKLEFNNLPEDRGEAVLAINRQYHAKLEEYIRQYPQQYFWFHRKWRD